MCYEGLDPTNRRDQTIEREIAVKIDEFGVTIRATRRIVNSTEKGRACIDPNGYDAGKKIKGKKRPILVDTQGLPMHAVLHAADIQDRDGRILVLASMFGLYPFRQKLFADAGYPGPKFRSALAQTLPHLSVEIVKCSDTAQGFELLLRRWEVERTFAWLNRCRRLAKDFKNLNRTAVAFIRLARSG